MSGENHASRGAHSKTPVKKQKFSDAVRKRRRRLIIVIVVLLVVIFGVIAGAYKAYTMAQSKDTPSSEISDSSLDNVSDDASERSHAPTTDVPHVAELLSCSVDDATARLGKNALLVSDFTDELSSTAIVRHLKFSLTNEPNDEKSGFPTVFVNADHNNTVVQVGYGVSLHLLGVGDVSFADAITQKHLIEKTLGLMGFICDNNQVHLPANPADYSKYEENGTTLKTQECNFEGTCSYNDKAFSFSAVLSYDFTAANLPMGNVSDTLRNLYVYVTAK